MNVRRLVTRAVPAVLSLAIVGTAASVASACPSCQTALAEGQGDLARGLYYSILFMLSMPFAIAGTFGCLAYRVVKREQRRREAEQEKQSK